MWIWVLIGLLLMCSGCSCLLGMYLVFDIVLMLSLCVMVLCNVLWLLMFIVMCGVRLVVVIVFLSVWCVVEFGLCISSGLLVSLCSVIVLCVVKWCVECMNVIIGKFVQCCVKQCVFLNVWVIMLMLYMYLLRLCKMVFELLSVIDRCMCGCSL